MCKYYITFVRILNKLMPNQIFMLKTILVTILITVLTLASCGHKGDKNDPDYKKVMAIHDEVMPKMSTIHKLKKKLRKLGDVSSPKVLQMLKDLDDADEGMMVWMSDFDPPAEGSERTTYLKAELPRVKNMADDINNAIAAAEQYLKANTNEQ